jgi:hypothetical protein
MNGPDRTKRLAGQWSDTSTASEGSSGSTIPTETTTPSSAGPPTTSTFTIDQVQKLLEYKRELPNYKPHGYVDLPTLNALYVAQLPIVLDSLLTFTSEGETPVTSADLSVDVETLRQL